MRGLKWVSVVGASAAFTLVSAPSASAQEGLAASCEPPSEEVGFMPDGSMVAQTFTSQLTGNATRAEIEIQKAGMASEGWDVEIRTVDASATPTGVVLASTTIPYASVPDGLSLVSIPFPDPAALAAGETYALSLSRLGSDPIEFGVREGDCPNELWLSDVDGTYVDWYPTPDPVDMVFRVFATPPTPPVPRANCSGQVATQVGTEGNDVIEGTPGVDVIAALGGKDLVRSLAGNDRICGGTGKDTLKGGGGGDTLKGGASSDALRGGGGKDRCVGGPGGDSARKCEVERST